MEIQLSLSEDEQFALSKLILNRTIDLAQMPQSAERDRELLTITNISEKYVQAVKRMALARLN